MVVDKDFQVLTFKLDEQEYALDINTVVQVVRMVTITRSPKAPAVVEGVINLRGKVIPVLNLRRRLELPSAPYGINNHLLIAQPRNSNGSPSGRIMGLIVDAVKEVLTIPAAQLDSLTDMGMHGSEYLAAVGKMGDRLLLILKLNSLLTLEEETLLKDVLKPPASPVGQEKRVLV